MNKIYFRVFLGYRNLKKKINIFRETAVIPQLGLVLSHPRCVHTNWRKIIRQTQHC
jgi:hypothetical protein